MRVYVNIFEPGGAVKRFPVGEKPIKIGRRDAAVQVPVSDELCSGIHAMLYYKSGSLYIEDLNSKNGVFLNGIKVSRQRLFVGDYASLGDCRIQIDTEKNPKDLIASLSSQRDRLDGEITLELETHLELTGSRRQIGQKTSTSLKALREQKEKDNYVASSKLYEGAAEIREKRRRNENAENQLNGVKRFMAGLLDLIIFFVVFAGVFSATKAAKPGLESYVYFFAGAVAGIIFFFWNRSRDKGSIGERLTGIA